MTLGGSHAYGTNVETSDIDIRGIAVNQGKDILLGKDFEQVQDNQTDTVFYSMDKVFHLLSNANPNVMELSVPTIKPEYVIRKQLSIINWANI